MASSFPPPQVAILDTSFWTAAYRAEVVANSLDLFEIIVPPAVEREILGREPGDPRREYPHATLFRHLRTQMRPAPPNAPSPLQRFGAGEAAAIPLAQSLDALLLINERRATAYARNVGIAVVTVAEFVVVLRALQIISHRAAHRKPDLIAPITAEALIAESRQTLDWLEPSSTEDDDNSGG